MSKSFEEQINAERERQDYKWGGIEERNTDLFEWVTILTEETGEIAKSVLEADYKNLAMELVQVASVCKAIYETIHHRGLCNE